MYVHFICIRHIRIMAVPKQSTQSWLGIPQILVCTLFRGEICKCVCWRRDDKSVWLRGVTINVYGWEGWSQKCMVERVICNSYIWEVITKVYVWEGAYAGVCLIGVIFKSVCLIWGLHKCMFERRISTSVCLRGGSAKVYVWEGDLQKCMVERGICNSYVWKGVTKVYVWKGVYKGVCLRGVIFKNVCLIWGLQKFMFDMGSTKVYVWEGIYKSVWLRGESAQVYVWEGDLHKCMFERRICTSVCLRGDIQRCMFERGHIKKYMFDMGSAKVYVWEGDLQKCMVDRRICKVYVWEGILKVYVWEGDLQKCLFEGGPKIVYLGELVCKCVCIKHFYNYWQLRIYLAQFLDINS